MWSFMVSFDVGPNDFSSKDPVQIQKQLNWLCPAVAAKGIVHRYEINLGNVDVLVMAPTATPKSPAWMIQLHVPSRSNEHEIDAHKWAAAVGVSPRLIDYGECFDRKYIVQLYAGQTVSSLVDTFEKSQVPYPKRLLTSVIAMWKKIRTMPSSAFEFTTPSVLGAEKRWAFDGNRVYYLDWFTTKRGSDKKSNKARLLTDLRGLIDSAAYLTGMNDDEIDILVGSFPEFKWPRQWNSVVDF